MRAALIGFVYAATLSAASLSVATGGNDSNLCTVAQPCLTLARAEAVATAGDTVTVSTGTYTGDVTWAKGVAWVCSGSVTIKPSAAVLTVTGNSTWSITGCTLQANGLATTLVFDSSSNGSKAVASCTFSTNPTSKVIDIQGSGTYSFTSPTVTTTASLAALVNASTASKTGTISITGATMSATALTTAMVNVTTAGGYTLSISGGSYTQSGNSNVPIVLAVDQPSTTVTGATIDTSGSGTGVAAVWVKSTGTSGLATITNNTIYVRDISAHYGVIIGDDDVPPPGGLKLNGSIVSGNTIRGYRYFNPGTTPSMSLHAIIIGAQINATVTSNNIAGAGYGVIAKGSGCALGYTWTSGMVAYNTIWNQATDLNGVIQGLYSKGSCAVPFYNNTVWLGLTSSPVSNNNAQVTATFTNNDTGQNYAADNNIFKNNIIAGVDVGRFFSTNLGGAGNVWDYNDYYVSGTFGGWSGGGGAFARDGGGSYANFAAWQGAGYEAHGINSNPLFNDPSNGDFRLKVGSPAVRAGLFVSGVGTSPTPNIGSQTAVVTGLFPGPGGFRW